MLSELRVENFAIIQKMNVSFEKGLTVITGETGAGKSIIIDAITLLVGGRGSPEYVRHGAEKTELEALFEIDANHPCVAVLEALGIEVDEDMLVLRRQISKNGKSVCRVNGKLVTLTNMRDVGQHLIDIHGQHEHQELLLPEKHIQLLDRFGDKALHTVKADYEVVYTEARHVHRQIEELSENERQIAQRLDLLRYQIKEISEAGIQLDEEDGLLEERKKLVNFEKIYDAVRSGYDALNGDQKGLDWLRIAVGELESIQGLDADLEDIAKGIASNFYLLEEQAYRLRDHYDQMEYEPERLNVVEGRLDEFNNLKRKYGKTLAEVESYFEGIKREYDDLTDRDHTIDALNKRLNELMVTLSERADHLTKIRKQAGDQLVKAINRELKDLYMEKARFAITVDPDTTADKHDIHTYHRSGRDRVEFNISTNPGEPLKPLARIASGGEMSRIMLAIKSHFKSFRGVTSIIFDEVDTGVSGRVAQAMAEKIFHISNASQVFCITHLPQVAAMADQHLYISKKVKGNSTSTRVERLSDDDKAAEIARMISGVEMTDLTKQHAHELLELAREIKT